MVRVNELRVDNGCDKLIIDVELGSKLKRFNTLYPESAVYIEGIYIDTEDTYLEGKPSENCYMVDINEYDEHGALVNEKPAEVRVEAGVSQILKFPPKEDTVEGEDDDAGDTQNGEGSGDTTNAGDDVQNEGDGDDKGDEKPVVPPEIIPVVFSRKPHHNHHRNDGDANVPAGPINPEPIDSVSDHLFFVYVKLHFPDDAHREQLEEMVGSCNLSEYKVVVTMCVCKMYNLFMRMIRELNRRCEVPQGFVDLLLKWNGLTVSIDAGHYEYAIKYFKKWFKHKGEVEIARSCGCSRNLF